MVTTTNLDVQPEDVSFGYCKLCRAKEIELYGTLTENLKKHIEACKLAGCKHPHAYT